MTNISPWFMGAGDFQLAPACEDDPSLCTDIALMDENILLRVSPLPGGGKPRILIPVACSSSYSRY